MKRILFLFLLLTAAHAADPIIRPAGFPYGSGARPTNGATPGTTTRVPGTINRTGYSDNPSMWTLFIGGADQMCQDTNELYSINPKGRLEFQTAWVKDIGFGTNVPGMYVLKGGLDNTNWLQLAYISNSLFYPTGLADAVNIYNSDGEQTGNRLFGGGGFNLNLVGHNNVGFTANNNLSLTAGNAVLMDTPFFRHATLVADGGNFIINNNSTMTNRYQFSAFNLIASGTDAVMFRTVSDPAGGTDGQVKYDPAITHAMLATAGQNLANADLTADAPHTFDFNSFRTTFAGTGGEFFINAPGGYISFNSTNTYVDIADDRVMLGTPRVFSGDVLAGEFLVNLLGGDAVDFATVYYKGLATGTPGTWVAATATLVPAYNDGAQPPEGTIAYLKFNANSVGSDTLQLGDSTTGIAITRADGLAIQADDITAGQYIMFVRAGTTSGSHWVCESCGISGVSPASGSVVAIDTTADLASEVAAIAITQGYTTVGDGGHGAYRADSLSAEAINNVTVFDRTAGGRYLLMTSGAISAKQAGAVGDGVANDHDALQALFDVCVNMTARIEPLEYLSTTGLTVPAGVRVIAYGSTITCDTSGDNDRAIDMESNTKWEGGTVIDHRVSGGNSGEDHVAFRIGHYADGVGQSNIVIKNVTISTDWNNDLANGILITGNSHDVTLDGIRCENNSTIRTVIALHWGFIVDGDETAGTLHPYNINISNVNVGELTAATGDVTPVSIAACYNVNVNNVRSKRARYGLVYTCGDFGYRYSGFQGLAMGSVNVNNLTCERGFNAGILVVGVDSNGDVWPLEGSFNNFTLIGSNDATGQSGIFLQSALGTTFRNGVISGFEQGALITNATKNIAFYDTLFTTNRLGGFVYNDEASSNAIVSHCKFQNNGWGLSGTNAAAILLVDGANIRIENNEIGNPETEANQEVGISLNSSVANVSLVGNYVLSVKSGGVNFAYNVGDTADGTSLALFENNLAAPGILITDAAPNLIVKATDGAGTDKAGGEAALRGGLSTGTGAGGPVSTATSLSGSTGTTLNAYSTRSYIAAKPTDLTEATATTFCNITLPDAAYLGCRLACTTFASDGTDHQVSHSPVTFSAVNKAGTITISSVTVGAASQAASAGTLTPVTFTVVQNGNSVDVKVAATSSLTQTVLRVKWAIVELNSNGEAAITAF